MNASGDDTSSVRRAAWVAGVAYLLAIPPSLFDEFFVTGKLVTSSAAQTAANLAAHDRLFRCWRRARSTISKRCGCSAATRF
jgi:hypothetical protein